MDVRYANGSGTAQTVHLGVNGTLQQLTLAPTAGWDSWAVAQVPVTLTAGTDTLAVTVAQDDTARVNVDYLAPYPAGAQPPTEVAPATTGTTSGYRQSLDLRTGVLTTSFDWTSPAGDRTGFVYAVDADRAQGHLGTVTVRVTPHWSGTATAVDEFDGRGLDHATAVNPAVDARTATLSENVVTDGKLVTAALNSVLRVDGRAERTEPLTAAADGSAGQSAAFPVRDGRTYEITKYVGVASSVDTDRPLTAATPQQSAARTAADAAKDGYGDTLARNDSAWSRLWQSSISVPGDTAMTARIHASMFYLLASVRSGVTWSTGPGRAVLRRLQRPRLLGLRDLDVPGAAGHRTRDIAQSADTYRQNRLPAAGRGAAADHRRPSRSGRAVPVGERALRRRGRRRPGQQRPALYEIHVNADISLASGSTGWPPATAAGWRPRRWPVLKGIADFWATRASPTPTAATASTRASRRTSTPSTSTTASTPTSPRGTPCGSPSRRPACSAGPADPAWATVAAGLRILFDSTLGIHPEYQGYPGDAVKQADVTLLSYPWEEPQPAAVTQADLDYYVPRTDPGGPSMTDAIHSIDTLAARLARLRGVHVHPRAASTRSCAAPYDQFSEARTGGAFTFTTGAGGFLQEFLYGYTGLRWRADAVTVDPSLPPSCPASTSPASSGTAAPSTSPSAAPPPR